MFKVPSYTQKCKIDKIWMLPTLAAYVSGPHIATVLTQ